MLTKEQYEEKRQARYDRLLAAAERAERESTAAYKLSDQMASVIPMGQPILIGHYSEKRDRRYRERIHNKMRKGYELHQKAEYYKERAASVEHCNAIFSDDPEAVAKIGDKVAQLEKRQELMKAANKLVRKNDREGLLNMGFTETQVEKLFSPRYGPPGFPSYELTNNGANIRRLKERAQQVERKQAMKDEDLEINGVRIEGRPSENRIHLYYGKRVDYETYKLLKQHGFRVLRSEGEGAFSAYYNSNALYFIKTYIQKA